MRCIWIINLVLMPLVAWANAPEVLTNIAAIRNLSRETARAGLPVQLRGVVTWNGGANWFIFQDDSGGITVNLRIARSLKIWNEATTNPPAIKVGDEVAIEGVSHAAGFAPDVLPKSLRVLGQKPLPPARPMVPARFFAGADACERIEVRGVIQGFEQRGTGLFTLQVDANPGRFTVEGPAKLLSNPKELVDAEVRLRGVAGTFFNSRGEVIGARLLIALPGDLVVERAASPSPFDAPLLPLNQLSPFRPEPFGPHRQLVEGTVIYEESGRIFYIQDENTSVRLETLTPENIQMGDRVQVAGFLDMRRQVAGLIGAVVRKVGTAVIPEPVAISPEQILHLNASAMLHGQVPEPNDLDGRLITFRARLLNVLPSLDKKPPGSRLALDANGTIVEALLCKGDASTYSQLQPGSELQVTGVVEMDFDFLHQIQGNLQNPLSGLHVLLRSAEGVSVVHAPPWWTPPRLISALAVGFGLLLSVMLWTWQLHRQLARKTKQLAVEMHARRDAAIEFKATLRERTRLAANLHDTLLQSISALNYQLEACETESLPRSERKANYLASARRIVQHAQQNLRGTVWALRVLPLDDRPFAEALRALAGQLAEGHDVNIIVSAGDALPKLSSFVAGNLLLVAQEAMHNSIKHGCPSRIETIVLAAPDGRRIALTVQDDGSGFDLQAAKATKAGHFGLEGMRERVERLGGTLKIESRPGHGTKVTAEVFLGAFDDDLSDS